MTLISHQYVAKIKMSSYVYNNFYSLAKVHEWNGIFILETCFIDVLPRHPNDPNETNVHVQDILNAISGIFQLYMASDRKHKVKILDIFPLYMVCAVKVFVTPG